MSVKASKIGPIQNVKVKTERDTGRLGKHFAETVVSLRRPYHTRDVSLLALVPKYGQVTNCCRIKYNQEMVVNTTAVQ